MAQRLSSGAASSILQADKGISASLLILPPHVYATVNGVKDVSEVFIEAGQVLVATCYAVHAKPAVNFTWTVNNRIAEAVEYNFTMTSNTEHKGTFDSMSVYRDEQPIDRGNISCISSAQFVDSGKRLDITYVRYVLPTVTLKLTGEKSGSVTHLEANIETVAYCNIHGSTFLPKVSWLMNNVPVDNETTHGTAYSLTLKTYQVGSTFAFVPTAGNGTISCANTLQEVNLTQTIEVAFQAHAPPRVWIMVNGQLVNQSVFLAPNEEVTAVCSSSHSDLPFNLTWMINEREIKESDENAFVDLLEDQHHRRPGHDITLKLVPETENGNFTCILSGKYIEEKRLCVYYEITRMNINGKEEVQKRTLSQLAITGTILVVLLSIGCYIYKRLRGLRKTKFESSLEYEDTTAMRNKIDKDNEVLNRPRMCLPKLPDDPVTSDTYSNVIENDSTRYYSTLTSRTASRRLFNESDVCLVLNMKMGDILNRWTGTVTQSSKRNKCVVISTASEAVSITKEVHWEAFVKRVMEIPDNESLVKIEGICVDGIHLYLLHEHLTCQTLKSSLSSIIDNNMVQISSSDFVKHTLGILEGIEVIHSYGFLHPWLSTRKILLTKLGSCKLYDFCLKEDASHIFAVKKSKNESFVSLMPTESLRRSEYFQESDVWSAAVVIWEMISCGLPPFTGTDYLLQRCAQTQAPDTWPAHFLQFRNPLLFDCWKEDPESRPTMQLLRSSFKEIFEHHLKGEEVATKSSVSTFDLYEPMKEASASDKKY